MSGRIGILASAGRGTARRPRVPGAHVGEALVAPAPM